MSDDTIFDLVRSLEQYQDSYEEGGVIGRVIQSLSDLETMSPEARERLHQDVLLLAEPPYSPEIVVAARNILTRLEQTPGGDSTDAVVVPMDGMSTVAPFSPYSFCDDYSSLLCGSNSVAGADSEGNKSAFPWPDIARCSPLGDANAADYSLDASIAEQQQASPRVVFFLNPFPFDSKLTMLFYIHVHNGRLDMAARQPQDVLRMLTLFSSSQNKPLAGKHRQLPASPSEGSDGERACDIHARNLEPTNKVLYQWILGGSALLLFSMVLLFVLKSSYEFEPEPQGSFSESAPPTPGSTSYFGR